MAPEAAIQGDDVTTAAELRGCGLDRRSDPTWRVLALAWMGAVIVGCSGTRDISPAEARGLCAVAGRALRAQGADEATAALERRFGTSAAMMRVTERGVYIPTRKWFVEESGYFLARPGAVPGGKGHDPSFELIAACLYTYRIKG